jgi:hypothetical protein
MHKPTLWGRRQHDRNRVLLPVIPRRHYRRPLRDFNLALPPQWSHETATMPISNTRLLPLLNVASRTDHRTQPINPIHIPSFIPIPITTHPLAPRCHR